MNPILRRGAWPFCRLFLYVLLLALGAQARAFDLQGHRGARGLAPENTLPGFERALALGVKTLETDLAITRDGVIVIHHDLELNPVRTRDAQGRWLAQPSAPIAAMSWSELQAYDLGRLQPGTGYARNFPAQEGADGVRMPRLADLLDLVRSRGDERIRLALEIKTDPTRPEATRAPQEFAALLVDELRRSGMLGRVQILSFDWRSLQAVQKLAPEVPTVYLSAQQRWLDNIRAEAHEASPWTAGLSYAQYGSVPAMIKAAGGRIWSAYFGDLDATKVQAAHALGLQVLAWTVNDPAAMRRVLDLGVDGLVTDRPDLAQEVLRERGVTPR